jgi:hypothetical protein
MDTAFFLTACGHFFSNDFFSEIDFKNHSYLEVISEDVFNALTNESLELENGIILQVAEDFEDTPVENLLGIIECLAQDFSNIFNEGKKFGLNLEADDKAVLALFSEEDLQAEIDRRRKNL